MKKIISMWEDALEFTGIPPHIYLISELEGFKHKIQTLKEVVINQLQDDMDKRGFSSTQNNTKTIIDAMASQTKQITEERVRNTEVLTSKVTK